MSNEADQEQIKSEGKSHPAAALTDAEMTEQFRQSQRSGQTRVVTEEERRASSMQGIQTLIDQNITDRAIVVEHGGGEIDIWPFEKFQYETHNGELSFYENGKPLGGPAKTYAQGQWQSVQRVKRAHVLGLAHRAFDVAVMQSEF